MKAMRGLVLASALVWSATVFAANLQVPKNVVAGQSVTINSAPGGTMYLLGPNVAVKQNVDAGTVEIPGERLQAAGRYTVVIGDSKGTFFVTNNKPESIAFLARPSRVPAAAQEAVTGTAFVFDRYDNLVRQPQPVKFELAVAGGAPEVRTATSREGAAWVKMNSGRKEGAAQFVASTGAISTKRVVQQVASDPCSIRMRAARGNNGNIVVETDPIRDCSGNAVPDGTIVTFTSVDGKGRSTIDARIKRGIARAELPASDKATISVAAGVVMGNEIRWGGGR